MNCTFRYWARIVAINISATMLATIAFSGVSWQTPWRHVVEAFSVSFTFSTCCSTLCAAALPVLVPAASRRFSFPLNWVAIAGALVGFASTGSLVALLILLAVGYVHTETFLPYFVGVLKISIIVTLVFGIFGALFEILRTRLDETTVALRTKERDEADARRLAAEAQLSSLESRVQPHFLFNTLNSIAALIPDDPSGAERMTGQLASLMRSSLDGSARPLVPLDEELRVVRAYLDIERVRFGDRLRYTIDVDDDAKETRVPRLAVQTLVENSVKYAVSPRREGGTIAVRAAATNGRVRIQVQDDGPGFDARDTPAGHGLALVRERLAMTLGDRAALRVDSVPGATTVELSVPSSGEPRSPSTDPRAARSE